MNRSRTKNRKNLETFEQYTQIMAFSCACSGGHAQKMEVCSAWGNQCVWLISAAHPPGQLALQEAEQ